MGHDLYSFKTGLFERWKRLTVLRFGNKGLGKRAACHDGERRGCLVVVVVGGGGGCC